MEKRNINFALRLFTGDYWVQTCLPMFGKSFLQKFKNLFLEELDRGQETEFFIRIFLMSNNFVCVGKSLFYWRLSEYSKTDNFNNKDKQEKLEYEYQFFKLIINHFKYDRQLSKEELKYFKWYLNYLLYETEMGLKQHFKLIRFGFSEIGSLNPILIVKILLLKLIRYSKKE